ncbi:MAG: PAS domain S-box protein [Deltaproteobacteria bacterium]|nr:PAS domain S-box protein [Myxococcales bacterium]MDP3220001.1 PAS domain S-box protein [Deltaproteobacteria bacterium]
MSDRPIAIQSVEPLGHVEWARELASGELTYLSTTVREFVGAPGAAEPGWDALRAAVHPDDAACFDAACNPADPGDRSFDFRYRRRGELRWASARVLRTAARIEGVIVDVTGRVHAEEATRVDRRRADALIAVASKISERLEVPDIARVLCVHALRAFGDHVRASFMLYEPDTNAFALVHSEGSPPGALEQPSRFLRDGSPFAEPPPERVLYAPDASVSEHARTAASTGVQGFAVGFLISGGTLLGALTVASFDRPLRLEPADLDLLRGMADQAASAVSNARVLTESRLNALRYRNILDTVFDGINITGFDGVIRYCNNQFAAMLGSTPDVVVGKAMRDLIFPEDASKADERIRRRRAGYAKPFTWRLRALDDGHEVLVRANSREIKNERGEPVAMLGVISDITSARRLEEKLLQTQKLESLGVLAGGIAHDFNNLLVGILGNAGLALVELPPGSPLRPLMDDIQAAAMRAADLTRQLLSYSGKGRFVLANLDVGAVVGDMTHLLASVVAKGVTLRYRLAASLPLIEGDASQIRQVVLSLVSNASDAIGERAGEVTVATSVVRADDDFLADTFVDDRLAAGDYVCLEVTDDGQGMSADTVGRIFDPFYTTKFVGRGLGLAAVLGILRGHKGAINVQSEPGVGTTLRAYFPVSAAAPEAPAPRAELPRSTRQTILVIDDEEGVRNVARRIFERANFKVIVAADGVEGLERFRECPDEVAAVLLDVTMPRMGGEETFTELRRLRADVRVLLSSGYSEQEAMGRFAGKGLAGFVEKPFRPQTLLDKLRAVIDGDPA